MAREFKYRAPTAEDLARQQAEAGSDFKGFMKDKYRSYSAKRGDNFVRILPRCDDPTYAIPISVHYNIGPDHASVLCPKEMRGEACPLCEERARELKRGDEDEARKYRPSKRYLTFVLDRNSRDDEGPFAWAMPRTVYNDLQSLAKDRRTGEIFDIVSPDSGYEIAFERQGEGVNTRYIGLQLGRKKSPVEDKYLDYVMDNPIEDTLRWRDYDEIQALFQGIAPRRDSGRQESRDSRSRDDRDTDSRRSGNGAERPSGRREEREDDRDTRRASRNGPDDPDSPPFDRDEREPDRKERTERRETRDRDEDDRGERSRSDDLRERWAQSQRERGQRT